MKYRTPEMIDYISGVVSGIAMNPGIMAGSGGDVYMRMNVTCPRNMMYQTNAKRGFRKLWKLDLSLDDREVRIVDMSLCHDGLELLDFLRV